MVYEVRVYVKTEVFSKKLKKHVVRWCRANKQDNFICKNKTHLFRTLSAFMEIDKELDCQYKHKYSIRVLKGGAKRVKA